MTVEEAIETALRTAIQAAIDAAGLSVSVRCWWLDDESGSTREDADKPAIAIIARPWVPGASLAMGTSQVGLSIVTTYQDDAKHADLLAIYDAVRGVIDADVWTVASPVDSLQVVVTDGDTFVDTQERRAVATLALDALVCVEDAG